MITTEIDLHCRAAETLIRQRSETGKLTIDEVRGHALAECLDERVLLVLCFGFARFGYPHRISPDDHLLLWACNLAAEAAGMRVDLQVA